MPGVIAQQGNLVLVDFGRDEDKPVSKKRLALMLGRSPRWVEYRVAEGMPASTDRRGRRIFAPSECREWLERQKGAAGG